MDKKDKEHHLKDAKALLTELSDMKCNIDGCIYPWNEVVGFRKECIEEFMIWVTTEKLDHIKIEKDHPREDILHFK